MLLARTDSCTEHCEGLEIETHRKVEYNKYEALSLSLVSTSSISTKDVCSACASICINASMKSLSASF
jgi:hypothetical protein